MQELPSELPRQALSPKWTLARMSLKPFECRQEKRPRRRLIDLCRTEVHTAWILVDPSISARTMAFSRDGNWVAYTSLTDNNLWRCTADGNECLQLTQGMQQTVSPRWSPDGRVITFMGRHLGGNWGVFTVAAKGENLQALSPSGHSDADPDWSPDGQSLVFGNVLEPPEALAIYTLNLRTHGLSALPESKGYFSPRWSPDGRFIVAIYSHDQRLDLFDCVSRKWERLIQISGAYPSWSRDGKYVYFLSIATGRRTVFRIGIREQKLEAVVDVGKIERLPSMMGDWMGLAPDDAPIVVRNVTTRTFTRGSLIFGKVFVAPFPDLSKRSSFQRFQITRSGPLRRSQSIRTWDRP